MPSFARVAVLVDPADTGVQPRLLLCLRHAVRDGRTGATGEPLVISERLQFVTLGADGSAAPAGHAPQLDLRPASADELEPAQPLLAEPWLADGVEQRAKAFAIQHLVPRHLDEVRAQRLAEIAKVEREVRSRLRNEIAHWDHRANQLRQLELAGRQTRLSSRNAAARAEELSARLEQRLAELARERQIGASPPQVVSAALVIPAGWLTRVRGEVAPEPALAEDRRRIELAAIDEVMRFEQSVGRVPIDVSAMCYGWDIESVDPATDERRFIEVKGRAIDADTVTITCNEVMAALNEPERWVLALVMVKEGFARVPRYILAFPRREPVPGEASVTIQLAKLLARTEAMDTRG